VSTPDGSSGAGPCRRGDTGAGLPRRRAARRERRVDPRVEPGELGGDNLRPRTGSWCLIPAWRGGSTGRASSPSGRAGCCGPAPCSRGAGEHRRAPVRQAAAGLPRGPHRQGAAAAVRDLPALRRHQHREQPGCGGRACPRWSAASCCCTSCRRPSRTGWRCGRAPRRTSASGCSSAHSPRRAASAAAPRSTCAAGCQLRSLIVTPPALHSQGLQLSGRPARDGGGPQCRGRARRRGPAAAARGHRGPGLPPGPGGRPQHRPARRRRPRPRLPRGALRRARPGAPPRRQRRRLRLRPRGGLPAGAAASAWSC